MVVVYHPSIKISPINSTATNKMNPKRVTEKKNYPKLSTTSTTPAIAASGGLIISLTDAVHTFLTEASTDSHLSKDLRDLSSSLIMHSTIPCQSLKTIWFGSKHETRPDLSSLLSGSNLIFTSPKPREKSEDLKVRLKKLEEAAERKAYQEMVKDITPKKGVEDPFSSYKDQLGVGLHVVLTMFMGYLVGYAAFRALFGSSPPMGQTAYTDKYIAKNYFEKHDRLMQQEFDNYIANEIPLGLSQIIINKNYVVPTLSDIHRDVTGEGSHRGLSSSIRFKLKDKLKSELTAHICEVIIIERLPSGVFADPFELQHLVQRGVFSDAVVFGDTNLELPSFRSNQSIVEIHMSMASKVFTGYEDDSEVNLDLPLHARYPPLGHGFSRVQFEKPDLFICCNLDGNTRNRSCIFMPNNHIANKKANPVIWEIPCGIKEHAGVVSAVTFGFAIVAAMLIVLASLCYSDSEGSNKLKHA